MSQMSSSAQMQRPTVFVSYHHENDTDYFERIQRTLVERYDLVRDSTVRRELRSRDADTIVRAIRERYIAKASCTIVLCGEESGQRRFVDWEIYATLDNQNGLICILLPEVDAKATNPKLPPRAQDNIESGYAQALDWPTAIDNPSAFGNALKRANLASKELIRNDRPMISA